MSRRPKQEILCAKSFGNDVTSEGQLQEAISCYIARAAEKLREQDSLASRLTVFLRTNGFDRDAPQYSNDFTIDLPFPTAFTPELIRQALVGLHVLFVQ
jgi:DNA polymerase V